MQGGADFLTEDRGTDRPPSGLGRISRADPRRHSDQPGRDRAARGFLACPARRGGGRPHECPRFETLIVLGQHGAKPVRGLGRKLICSSHGEPRCRRPVVSMRHSNRFATRWRKVRRTAKVIEHAQGWHRTNSYIPIEIISQMAELGCVRAHHSRGVRRDGGSAKEIDVRGLRGAVAGL